MFFVALAVLALFLTISKPAHPGVRLRVISWLPPDVSSALVLNGMALANLDLTLERVRARVLFSLSTIEFRVLVDVLRLADLVRILLVFDVVPEPIGGDILLLVVLTLSERLLCSLVAW